MYCKDKSQEQQQLQEYFSLNEPPTTDILNSSQLNDFTDEIMSWDNLYNWQHTMDPQDAILLSDPNFVRQHQLLQHTQQQQEMAMTQPSQNLEKKKPNQIHVSEANDNSKIDHQRRLNELQARFRVNNPRKSPHKSFSNNRKKLSSSYEAPSSIEIPPPITTPPPATTTAIMGSFSATKEDFFLKEQQQPQNATSSFPSRTMPIQIQRAPRLNQGQHMDAESFQKRLDDELMKVDFDDITVSELKDMLKQRGKPATGRKSILVQRLQDEKELAKVGRNRTNRHSFPLSLNKIDSQQQQQQQRPRSFHEETGSPVPTYLPLGSPGGQLSRSIANMHIGSPPTTTSSRRYSPYSPRSPKLPSFEYSAPLSSSPTTNPSPGNMDPARLTPGRYYYYNNNAKSYRPLTSSTLATPDRDEDVNPFDTYYENSRDDPPINDDMVDPATLDFLLLPEQSIDALDMNQQLYNNDDTLLSSLSTDQLMALLNTPAYSFKLDESVLTNKPS